MNYYKSFKPLLKPKKINNDDIAKECMKLWAEIVKLKAGNKCEFYGCHKTDFLNAHHVFSRSRQSTKYDIENGMCLCSGHHSLLTESAHKDPEFLNKALGKVDGYKPIRTENWFLLLRRRAYTPQKLDLKMECLYLRRELEKLKGNSGI